jgi:hypothetical protein
MTTTPKTVAVAPRASTGGSRHSSSIRNLHPRRWHTNVNRCLVAERHYPKYLDVMELIYVPH